MGFALRRYAIPSTIVVPHANAVEKNAAMRALGLKLLEYGIDFSTTREFAKKMAGEQSLQMVDYFDRLLVAGVAIYSLELLRAD